MERQNYSQLELFSKIKKGLEEKPHMTRSLVTFIKGYEKAILVVIGFIITGIISFSLGVERGRRTSTSETSSFLDMASAIGNTTASKAMSDRQKTNETQPQPIIKNEGSPDSPAAKESFEGYTVQVASYETKQHAEREATLLKKKGFSTLVLPKGKYVILCVGNFPSKKTASSLMLELRKRYKDCIIRRL